MPAGIMSFQSGPVNADRLRGAPGYSTVNVSHRSSGISSLRVPSHNQTIRRLSLTFNDRLIKCIIREERGGGGSDITIYTLKVNVKHAVIKSSSDETS